MNDVNDSFLVGFPDAPLEFLFSSHGHLDHIANLVQQGGLANYEAPTPSVFVALCREAGGVVLDVGANTGSFALLGLVHFLYHRSTTRIELTCYLQDLFTVLSARGQGVGHRLIEAVYATAREAGVHRVYWQTHQTNGAGRRLYDRVARHHGFIVYSHDV